MLSGTCAPRTNDKSITLNARGDLFRRASFACNQNDFPAFFALNRHQSLIANTGFAYLGSAAGIDDVFFLEFLRKSPSPQHNDGHLISTKLIELIIGQEYIRRMLEYRSSGRGNCRGEAIHAERLRRNGELFLCQWGRWS